MNYFSNQCKSSSKQSKIRTIKLILFALFFLILFAGCTQLKIPESGYYLCMGNCNAFKGVEIVNNNNTPTYPQNFIFHFTVMDETVSIEFEDDWYAKQIRNVKKDSFEYYDLGQKLWVPFKKQ